MHKVYEYFQFTTKTPSSNTNSENYIFLCISRYGKDDYVLAHPKCGERRLSNLTFRHELQNRLEFIMKNKSKFGILHNYLYLDSIEYWPGQGNVYQQTKSYKGRIKCIKYVCHVLTQ